jgi:hypothetical protein
MAIVGIVGIEGEPTNALPDRRDLVGDIEKNADRAGGQIEDLDRAVRSRMNNRPVSPGGAVAKTG